MFLLPEYRDRYYRGNKGPLYPFDIFTAMDDLSALQLVFSDHLAPHCLVKVRTETGKTKAPKPEYKSRQNMSVLLKVSAVSYPLSSHLPSSTG